jgi:hypothetical protein
MKTKVLGFILIFAALLAVGLNHTASKDRRQPPQQPLEPTHDRLRWASQKARMEGIRKVTLETPIGYYLGTASAITVDRALSTYTVVVAKPIEQRTYRETDNDLITWYKFRILEALSETKSPPCPGCQTSTPPAEMFPLQPDEFFMPKSGGNLTEDGIEIEQIEPGFPKFELGQKYLLLLSMDSSNIATTGGGPLGVFTIDENGSTTPLTETPHLIKEGMKQRFGNSLDRLKVGVGHQSSH